MNNSQFLPVRVQRAQPQQMVRYTALVRRQPRRSHRSTTLLSLTLFLALVLLYLIYQNSFLLARQAEPVQALAVTLNQPRTLPSNSLQPTLLLTPTVGSDLFAPLDGTPIPPDIETVDINPMFSLPKDDVVPGLPLPALTRPVSTTVKVSAQAEDPLVAAAKAEPQLYSTFLSAQDSLQQNDPEQAIAVLLTLAQNHPTYLVDHVHQLLYRAYLAAGDQQMREGAQTAAIDFYRRAQELPVTNQSALNRRLEGLTRFVLNGAAPAVITTTASTTAVTALPTSPTTVADPVTPSTPEAEPSPTPTLAVPVALASAQCPNPAVTITAPAVNTTLTGAVGFAGSALIADLWFYKLEWAAAGSETFAYFAGSRLPVSNGWLGTLDTNALKNGAYTIRLTVVDVTGNYPPPCDIAVRVEN